MEESPKNRTILVRGKKGGEEGGWIFLFFITAANLSSVALAIKYTKNRLEK